MRFILDAAPESKFWACHSNSPFVCDSGEIFGRRWRPDISQAEQVQGQVRPEYIRNSHAKVPYMRLDGKYDCRRRSS